MTEERSRSAASGYIGLLVGLVALAGGLWVLVLGIQSESTYLVIPLVALLLVAALSMGGLVVVQPNEARVLVLFGTYKGTVKHNGFFWVNPFYTKRRITLRSRNLNGQKLKVNDKGGNPIEIAAVVAARFQIVNGAVSMVELALAKLSERHVVELDEERKAAMVTNLLVVLCSETAASPVVNAGTLYT